MDRVVLQQTMATCSCKKKVEKTNFIVDKTTAKPVLGYN